MVNRAAFLLFLFFAYGLAGAGDYMDTKESRIDITRIRHNKDWNIHQMADYLGVSRRTVKGY